MSYTVLLYGATGFSGGLIAAEALARGLGRSSTSTNRLILAARDGKALKDLAKRHKDEFDFRVFGLDVRSDIVRNLHGVDVVLNAAGPFAFTAEALAKAALEYGCDYVDINGEVDVYLRLDDYGRIARQLGRRLVCGAGFLGGASNMLLGAALGVLARKKPPARQRLGDVRFGMTRLSAYTKGSAQSAWRSLREQVTIVRRGKRQDQSGEWRTQLVLWHEPLGKLEHPFDFTAHPKPDASPGSLLRICSAANFVDTLAARRTLAGANIVPRSIASYLELGALTRLAYAFGGALAPLSALPGVDGFARAQLAMLPDTLPDADLRDKQAVVLQIDGMQRERLLELIWETPNAYQFTAQLALEVALKAGAATRQGWLTPFDVLQPSARELDGQTEGAFRGCDLTKRQPA